MPRFPSLDGYLRSTETVTDEVDVTLRVAEGALPEGLRGVLYRNGPGKMEVYGTKYEHPFDGDGMVTRFSFEGGAVRYRNRFVRTEEYVAEERARRMLYRSFGTNLPGGLGRNLLRLRFKNAANTSVVLHGGKLLALWEGGLPHWLDPDTLETRGRYDYGGRLRNRTSLVGRVLAPELPFSAHPKRDVDTGELVNFGTLLGPTNQLASYRIGKDGAMKEPTFTRLDKLSFVHDFVLTKSYCVYFLPSVAFRVAATLLGTATPVGSLSGIDSAEASILLVPHDGRPPITLPARAGFLFHFANGYEDERGRVVLDGMRMDSLAPASVVHDLLEGRDVTLPETHPTRFTVDPSTRTVSQTRLSESLAELPTIDPRFVGRAYRHFWSIASRPAQRDPFFHRLMHFEHEGRERVRDFGRDFPGEPLFVPRPGGAEGEGWVLSLVYREAEHRSDLYVLDADDLEIVCRLELPHHVPPGFHGTWVASSERPS
jgi:all-trans-8'-apo-beta-carotenal 15,15'-oxygenase